jgi:hypothetical protein
MAPDQCNQLLLRILAKPTITGEERLLLYVLLCAPTCSAPSSGLRSVWRARTRAVGLPPARPAHRATSSLRAPQAGVSLRHSWSWTRSCSPGRPRRTRARSSGRSTPAGFGGWPRRRGAAGGAVSRALPRRRGRLRATPPLGALAGLAAVAVVVLRFSGSVNLEPRLSLADFTSAEVIESVGPTLRAGASALRAPCPSFSGWSCARRLCSFSSPP